MKKRLLTAAALILATSHQTSFQAAQAAAAEPFTILIDAGHGGHDTGASQGSLNEKDVNLKLALELKQALEKHGIKVSLTRSVDQELELSERAVKVQQAGADCVVSLHLDTPEAQGPVYELHYFGQGKAFASVLDSHLRTSLSPATEQQTLKESALFMVKKIPVPAVLVNASWQGGTQHQQALITGLTQGLLAYAQTHD